MLGTLLTFFAVGLVALIVLGIALSVLGLVFSLAFGFASLILFKIAPVVLVGWLVLKLLDRRKARDGISSADREWLESGQ
jgi:hypothetical protein